MAMLIYIASAFAVIIMKAWQVKEQFKSSTFSWKYCGIIVIAWCSMTVPSMLAACSKHGCQLSLNFSWLSDLIQAASYLDNSRVVIFGMVVYAVLTVYSLGYFLGLTMHSAGKLTRALN